MAVRIVVGVTDQDWFEHLRGRPDLAEVNFWSPMPRPFRALVPGELYLFKLKSPIDRIVGGGIFTHATEMPSSLAWTAFGESNGASSLGEMRRRIAKYRRTEAEVPRDFAIGCRILTGAFFWPEDHWLPVPASWAKNIVSFKSWSTDDAEGRQLWDAVAERSDSNLNVSSRPRFGTPQVIAPRLGQGAFRVLVTDIYDRRCAVTQERTLPALEAAHIQPYSDGGAHEARNGLLLRRDIHSLFDAGYVTVTPDLHFEVSRRIKEEFDNGRHYYALHGHTIRSPADPRHQPNKQFLRWHNENRFLT